MRFLHTSDWHLGRIFHGLHLLDDQAAVLEDLLALARDSHIDCLLLAGDVYDRSVPPADAVRVLDETLRRLILDLHIPVILIAGNHDNPDRLNFGQAFFATEKLFITSLVSADTEPIVLQDASGPVYFAPLTYCEPLTATELSGTRQATHEAALRWQIDCLLQKIPAGARKVALAHAFVTGAQVTPESERPLAAGGSTSVSLDCFDAFQYTALGHLHALQKCSDKVRYCGSLMKYSFSEVSQKKSAILVDMDAAGRIQTEAVPLRAPHELAVLKGTFDELLNGPLRARPDDYLQVILTDRTPVLDPKNRLEKRYPHILLLGYEGLEHQPEAEAAARRKGLGEEELFEAFFREIQGRSLDDRERALLRTVMDGLQSEGRHA